MSPYDLTPPWLCPRALSPYALEKGLWPCLLSPYNLVSHQAKASESGPYARCHFKGFQALTVLWITCEGRECVFWCLRVYSH